MKAQYIYIDSHSRFYVAVKQALQCIKDHQRAWPSSCYSLLDSCPSESTLSSLNLALQNPNFAWRNIIWWNFTMLPQCYMMWPLQWKHVIYIIIWWFPNMMWPSKAPNVMVLFYGPRRMMGAPNSITSGRPLMLGSNNLGWRWWIWWILPWIWCLM